jgi:hypothetical protein
MPAKKRSGRTTVPARSQTNLSALPKRFAISDTEIQPVQLFVNGKHHPKAPGPWQAEPDKIAWVDPRTGKDCILLRQRGGEWAGYVAVDPAHPLWGFSADAIPASAGLVVHGPIDYAAPCEDNKDPEISVCDITSGRLRTSHQAPPRRASTSGDVDRTNWWFGFSADQPGDHVPGRSRPLDREEGQVYRDIDYMFGEVTTLASQLNALEDDRGGSIPLAEIGAPVPKLSDSKEKR